MKPATVRWTVCACCLAGAIWLGWCSRMSLSASDDQPPSQSENQVLVLESGRIMKGRVSRSPNGYVVEHLAGRLVIPFDEVRVVGDSLTDAYHRLRESFPEPTASTHYDLARWCWTYHLRDDARAELVLALDRDPDFDDARDLLERIDEQLKMARKQKALQALETQTAAAAAESGEVESLAGLSRETAARFSTRVQPLLINKCGNASCHGPQSTSSFQLESTRGGGAGHRIHSERNLAALLEYLDLERPGKSRLLAELTANHGGRNRAIFFGSAGQRQLETLREWVQSVASEKSKRQRQRDSEPSVVDQQPKFPPDTQLAEASASEDIASDAAPASNASVKSDTAAGFEDDVPDAFDPEVFNRRYHGEAKKKASRDRNSPRRDQSEENP